MAVKKSIRLSSEAERLCHLVSPTGEPISPENEPNYSGSLNAIAHRYNVIMESSLPDLSVEEKVVFATAYSGIILSHDIKLEAQSLEQALKERYLYDPLLPQLICDAGSTVDIMLAKIESWSLVERIAVIDMTQRTWANGYTNILLGF